MATSPSTNSHNIAVTIVLSCAVGTASMLARASVGDEPKAPRASVGNNGEVKDTTGSAAPNRIAASIAGRWIATPQLQQFLDDNSPTPDFEGTLDTFDVQFIQTTTFWADPELRHGEKAMKELASRRNHEIVGTGGFGASKAKRPLDVLFGYFMLTQKEGETFLCVLNIDGVTFTPWRLFHIPGKTRGKDLLLVELADVGRKRVVAFQFQSEVP